MIYIVISLIAFFASLLTFFSGFGLGTILLPVFIAFFPIHIAISLTAIVHLLNNIFKISLLFKHVNYRVVLKFGIPSLMGAILGAYWLTILASKETAINFLLFGRQFSTSYIKISISCLMFLFALIDLFPAFSKIFALNKVIIPGGFISGFFGGLSGHQGALRSMFLIRLNLSKEVFIASGIAVACLVDVGRLIVYLNKFISLEFMSNANILSVAIISAFSGAFIGKRLLKKITLKSLHIIVGVAIILFSLLLGSGII